MYAFSPGDFHPVNHELIPGRVLAVGGGYEEKVRAFGLWSHRLQSMDGQMVPSNLDVPAIDVDFVAGHLTGEAIRGKASVCMTASKDRPASVAGKIPPPPPPAN